MELHSITKSLKLLKILFPSYFKSIFSPVPLWVHLNVTSKCNLKCDYCFIRDNKKAEMNINQLKQVVDKLYSLDCRFISFFGGEPTLKKGFVDLVKYTTMKGIVSHMSTNGTLLTPEYIDELGSAGIDVINLSVDSVYEFEASTKSYSHRKKVLDLLIEGRKKYGFDINVNFVLTRKNLDATVDTIKRIGSHNIPISIGLIINNTLNEKVQDQNLFFNTDEEKQELFNLMDEIILLKKKGYNIIEPTQYFHDIKKFVRGDLDWYCCAGEYYFSVDSDGKFQLCAGLPAEDFSIFDIEKDYFKKLANKRKTLQECCGKICMSNCLYDTSYFIKHPFYFLKELI
jgi:MoaA/NifB/PqqE/SkfB family radical SAM enzyme